MEDYPLGTVVSEKLLNVSDTETIAEARSRAATLLVKRIRDESIPFPYQRFFRSDAHALFNGIANHNSLTSNEAYSLYSYYPQYALFLPPYFRGRYLSIGDTKHHYVEADALSDLFVEDVRIKGRKKRQVHSPYSAWMDDNILHKILCRALALDKFGVAELREIIYNEVPETRILNPTWIKKLLQVVVGSNLKGKKWLDISAGWGDRLLVAMCLDMEYSGYDPNILLKKGHDEMIVMFGDASKHKVIYEPFEKASVSGMYDVILTSPPYFDVEEYMVDQEGQSIVSYPDFNEWLVKFLFASLSKAWEHLNVGGYLILHLGDTREVKICEVTNIFIEQYLPGASAEGVIGVMNRNMYRRPVWIYQKVQGAPKYWISYGPQQPKKGDMFSSKSKRALYFTYPNVQNTIIHVATQRINGYSTTLDKVKKLKEVLASQVPDTASFAVLTGDLVLLTCLVQTHSIDECVRYLLTLLTTPHL